jgi:hypothetical protein
MGNSVEFPPTSRNKIVSQSRKVKLLLPGKPFLSHCPEISGQAETKSSFGTSISSTETPSAEDYKQNSLQNSREALQGFPGKKNQVILKTG